MIALPTTAMVFAAGLGTRMRAHAPDIPKPLVMVAGKPLIHHVLDQLAASGITRAVVNLAYKGEQIARYLEDYDRLELVFSHEEKPLETGGGLLHARRLLDEEPFLCVNSDALWTDGKLPALQRMALAFDPDVHDALLLVCPLEHAIGYEGGGDFIMTPEQRLRRPSAEESASVVFTGVQILHPRVFEGPIFADRTDGEVFSISQLYRTTEEEGVIPRIGAILHDGSWMHVGDTAGVQAAEQQLAS